LVVAKIIDLFVIFLCFVWFLRKYGMFLDLGIKSSPPCTTPPRITLHHMDFSMCDFKDSQGCKAGAKRVEIRPTPPRAHPYIFPFWQRGGSSHSMALGGGSTTPKVNPQNLFIYFFTFGLLGVAGYPLAKMGMSNQPQYFLPKYF
jgi:hypothetical protein